MEQQMVLPEGGLASFLTSNLDEIDDSRLAFGRQNGINSMRETAERMAQLGRNGDDVLIHATKQERLIPKEVSEANPELMTQVDIAIADAGADPSAYIVGNETNSVNPYTGQSEFFFKKLISNVKNVFKKLAPIVVPFALNFIAPGLGSIASGFIGSGITGLVQGKGFKESLKMGFQGALIGGLTSGLRGGFSKDAGGTFGSRFMQGIEQTGLPTGENIFEGRNALQFDSELSKQRLDPVSNVLDDGLRGDYTPPSATPISDKFSSSFKDTFYNQGTPGTPGMTLADATDAVRATGIDVNKVTGNAQIENLMASTAAVPGSIKLLPTAAAVLAGGAALGGFDPIPAVEVEDPYAGESESERRLRLDPGKYASGIPIGRESATLKDIMVGPIPQLYEQYLDPQRAAAGGQMESFPRRTGYIAGPGTETSDDIPAMLSDGEFVMNAKAVRGAGGGSREKGVRKMYDMMRAFEGGAVA